MSRGPSPALLSGHRSVLGRFSPFFPVLCLAVVSAIFAQFFLARLGMKYFTVALGGLVVLFFLARISIKDLSIALTLWMFSMSGFRTVGLVGMPGLPDFSFDRLLLVWIIVVFLLRMIIERKRMKGPYWADALILIHTVYSLVQLLILAPGAFHAWVLSSLSPFFAYLYGKYIINREKEIRNVMIFFLVISIYYYITAFAEHFGWHFLVWPKCILDPNVGSLWHPGRARGPVMHPPLFGQLSGMFLLVHFYLLTRNYRPAVRVLLSISFVLSLLGLLFAMTRGPWIATTMGILVLGILRPRFRAVISILLIVALLAGMVGVLQLANTKFLQERIHKKATWENRLSFWSSSLRMIRDYPLFGMGFFQAKKHLWIYNQGTNIPFYGFVKKKAGEHMVPHDIYIGRAADEGLVSIFILMLFFLVILKAFIFKWRRRPDGPWFNLDSLALFAAVMVCFYVGGMAIDYRYFDLVNVIFFFLAGLIYGYRNEELGFGLPPARAIRPRIRITGYHR